MHILRQAYANILKDMKLFFFWPCIWHDPLRCAQEAILSTERIEAIDAHDLHTPGNLSHDHTNTTATTTPMDIDVQNA